MQDQPARPPSTLPFPGPSYGWEQFEKQKNSNTNSISNFRITDIFSHLASQNLIISSCADFKNPHQTTKFNVHLYWIAAHVPIPLHPVFLPSLTIPLLWVSAPFVGPSHRPTRHPLPSHRCASSPQSGWLSWGLSSLSNPLCSPFPQPAHASLTQAVFPQQHTASLTW